MPQESPPGQDEQLVEVWAGTLAAEGVELNTAGLISALSNPHSYVRTGAALILGRRGEDTAIPHLKSLLKDTSLAVRVEAAMSLALLGDKSGIPVLIEALHGELLTGAPLTAASYLAELDDERGHKVVLKALSSDLAGIRLMAAVALKSFISLHGKQIDLYDVLCKAVKDPDPAVRRELLYRVAALDDPRASDLLSSVMNSDDDEFVRQTAEQLLTPTSDIPG